MMPETVRKTEVEAGLSNQIFTSGEDGKDANVAQLIRLVSSDGQVFVVERQMAVLSKTLAMFLDPANGWQESVTGTVLLQDINGRLLTRIVDFLRHRIAGEPCQLQASFDIRPEESLELLLVADYLDM
jgi:transcription elongation factor B subunit 1